MSEKLAIDGGTPVLKRNDYGNWPIITEDDRRFINEVLDSGIVAGGTAPQVAALETEWAAYVGSKYCLTTTCSGTAALHMALAAVGVGPGDEVITSAFTFLASASCALHQNAIPVFVDIDPRTYNMDPAKLEAAITERTKAIIPVHIQGLPADLDPILAIARKHNLYVIEDACQAHGAEYKGKKVGTIGDIGTFSLNNFKNLCGGEGGLFITDDEDLSSEGRPGPLLRRRGRRGEPAPRLQRLDPGLHVPQPGAAGRPGPRPAHAPGRAQRGAHRQRQLPDRGAEQDPRRHPAVLPARVQARLLHV